MLILVPLSCNTTLDTQGKLIELTSYYTEGTVCSLYIQYIL